MNVEKAPRSQSRSDEANERTTKPQPPATADERLATAGRTQWQLGLLFAVLVVLCLVWAFRSDERNDLAGSYLLVFLGGVSALVSLFFFIAAQKTKAQFLKQVENEKKNAAEKTETDARQARMESMIAELAAVRSGMKTCPKCGSEMPISTKFCPECGAPTKAKCAKCGTEITPGVKFCPECGAEISPKSKLLPKCGEKQE